MNLRPVTPADLPVIRQISRRASTNPDRTPDEWALSWIKYVDPYVQIPDNVSLLLELPDGNPGGYVLCLPDSRTYFRILEDRYRPEMEKLAPGSYEDFLRAQSYIRDFAQDYPAHLHINTIPESRGQGSGSRLLEGLFQELRDRKVPGVCLGVDASREKAVRFYLRHGFQVLREANGTLFMGRKLTS